MYTPTLLYGLILASSALAIPATKRQSAYNSTEPPPAPSLDLIQQLQLAPTAVDRITLLQPQDFKYDFTNPPESAITTGEGGHTVKADRKVFPALIGTGVGMTVGFIGPCGFNTPHTHPRSSEFNIVVQGRLGTEFIAENGAPAIQDTLERFQATVFPKGALHTEFNPDCTEAIFVAGFGSEDPGVQQAAQTLFGLDPTLVAADLGGVEAINGASIDEFKGTIPANVALGVESCLAKCGIAKRTVVV